MDAVILRTARGLRCYSIRSRRTPDSDSETRFSSGGLEIRFSLHGYQVLLLARIHSVDAITGNFPLSRRSGQQSIAVRITGEDGGPLRIHKEAAVGEAFGVR